jgi:hypothetical protein
VAQRSLRDLDVKNQRKSDVRNQQFKRKRVKKKERLKPKENIPIQEKAAFYGLHAAMLGFLSPTAMKRTSLNGK